MAMNAYYIPDGPKNLALIFTDVDFSKVTEYYVEAGNGSDVIATTPVYKVEKPCGDSIRIAFVNYLGAMDYITCCRQAIDHDAKSDQVQSPLRYPLVKSQPSISRLNVKSNDTYTVVTDEFNETDLDFLDELFDSPIAWIQWDGTEGQEDSYLPIVIKDATLPKLKADDRFSYETIIQFTFSNDRINIRSNA